MNDEKREATLSLSAKLAMPLTGANRSFFDRFGPKTRYDLPQRHKAATGIVNHIHVLIISSQIFPKRLGMCCV